MHWWLDFSCNVLLVRLYEFVCRNDIVRKGVYSGVSKAMYASSFSLVNFISGKSIQEEDERIYSIPPVWVEHKKNNYYSQQTRNIIFLRLKFMLNWAKFQSTCVKLKTFRIESKSYSSNLKSGWLVRQSLFLYWKF